ncbi:molecular chaperone TorD family protein [Saccharolobus caldissimus]|uniref:Uncharacterized protein n=1 Tax=Saccharolobus caldissimus TaxID=1702097 RepID=A0AAQ4CUS4_9CREN|nr:molecular chaperone TorD family protein [Saccharolobus caldissimus]BDB99555.1 hypothetical protein SACC_25720 [Saccharolobus caldissimus]
MEEVNIKDTLSFFKYILLDFLSQAFHYPYKLKDIKDLQNRARQVEEIVRYLCDEKLFEKFERFKNFIDSINDINKLTEIEIQFVELDKPYNVNLSLYESINRFGYYDLVTVNEIRGLYNAVGIDPQEEPDLLSTELGFLAFLYFAKATGNDTSSVISTFLNKHVNKWVPRLAEGLAKSNYQYFSILGELLRETLRCIGNEG